MVESSCRCCFVLGEGIAQIAAVIPRSSLLLLLGGIGVNKPINIVLKGETHMSQFVGKVALVTGGTAGIGRATALAFAREGAKVTLAGRRVAEGEETVHLIKQQGGDARFVQTDVTKASDVEHLINAVVSTYGRLDYALNSAGTQEALGPITALSEDDFERTMNINLKGTWLSLKAEVAAMLKQGGRL